ncbi:UNVERIFIED_CONTAM: hypothetical protein GTU68_065321 [Idotea baltica]|nr:hypothetical protein [Idotea baltica]
MVFKHAENNADTHTEYNLSFFSPDDLQLQKLSADLVLIDEAAAIPIPLLTDFLKHYSRIVFSSTQHGYEGSGRGFAINFRKVLDREAPEWKSCELKQPIRWQENDTLEQFTFDALLLNAEAADDSLINKVTVGDCDFKQIDKQQLIKNNEKLKQLFGLLVSAHYQTKPSDLMQLLDDDSVSVYCLEANEQVVAVALLIQEGNIDAKLAKDIFAGNRRIPGHLVAQALSSNVGIESATQLSGERISRIAVHPSLQGMGLGSFLIDKLIKRSSADYLSTCYGATESLLHFWQKNNFLAVHIGIKRDASSGAHSVTMLHSKSNKGELLCGQAQSIFAQNFPHLLSDTLSELESEIVSSLLPEYPVKGLDDEEKKILCAFANESRGYENSLYLIYDLVLSNINKSQKLNEQEKKLLITKVLQKQSWQKMQQKWGGVISGKKQALALTRQAVLKLI